MRALQRTTALAAAAATVVALAACSTASTEPAVSTPPVPTHEVAAQTPTATPIPTPVDGQAMWEAAAAEAAPEGVPELLETTPISTDEYVARFTVEPAPIDGLDAVNAEYREAARVFPFPLPDGWAFPAETALIGQGLPDGWQHGDGYTQAFAFWQAATATAAFADFNRNGGDVAAHLDALTAGYESPVRAMYIDDPDLTYLDEVVAPAYAGDVDQLWWQEVRHVYGNPGYEAVAAHADDWIYLGTEGWAMAVPEEHQP